MSALHFTLPWYYMGCPKWDRGIPPLTHFEWGGTSTERRRLRCCLNEFKYILYPKIILKFIKIENNLNICSRRRRRFCSGCWRWSGLILFGCLFVRGQQQKRIIIYILGSATISRTITIYLSIYIQMSHSEDDEADEQPVRFASNRSLARTLFK